MENAIRSLLGPVVRRKGHQKGAALASAVFATALLVPMLAGAAPAAAGVGQGCSLDTTSGWRTCAYAASGPGVYEGHSAAEPWTIHVNGSLVASGGVKAGNLPTKRGDLVEVRLTATWGTGYLGTPALGGYTCVGRYPFEKCFQRPSVPSPVNLGPVPIPPVPGSVTARDVPSASNEPDPPQPHPKPDDTTPPAAPTSLTATEGDGEVSLDWADNTETDLSGYDVYRSTTAGGPYTRITWSPLAASAYTDSGLANGTTYYYVLTAVDKWGNESPYSSEAAGTPEDGTPPDTIIDSGPNGDTTATEATFEFHATEAGATLHCSLDGAAFSSCTSPEAYSGLKAGSHTFEVKAIDSAGNTDPTPASRIWTVEATAPSAPRDLRASTATRGKGVLLTWGAPVSDGGSPITGYRIYRAIAGEAELLASVGTVLSYKDQATKSGVTYRYWVAAVNAIGEGPFSNEGSARAR